ncbi:MAG TPA: TonB-dependent receptor [Bacteroidota bacterium]|jgi:hypothetical protein
MFRNWYKFLSFSALVVLLSVQAVLAGNGKIEGDVKTDQGEPLIGANVTLVNTLFGAAADVKGHFFVLNVPPGTYSVRASAVGYAPKVLTGVIVSSDQIVTLEFSLESETVGLEEITIQAERPVVDKSQTSARTNVSRDEFTSLPIRTVTDLVQTAPSTYKGFVRGGRQFETKTIVDGIDLTDQFYVWAADGPGGVTPYATYNGVQQQSRANTATLTNLNISSVEEANVLTGAVGSDYNSATAGVIAYSLREGRGPWTGRVEYRTSQTSGLKHFGPEVYNDDTSYFKQRDLNAASSAQSAKDKALRYTYTRDKYKYGGTPDGNLEGAFGGAVSEDFGLYFTGGYFNSHGRLPNEFKRRINSSMKMNYNLSKDMRLNFTGLLEDRGKIFGWKNRSYVEDFRFFLEGVPTTDGATLVGSLKWTHVLSPSTFYEVQLSLTSDNSRSGYSDDNGDGIVSFGEDGDYLTFSDTAQVYRYMARGSSPNTDFTKFFSPAPRNETLSEAGYTYPSGPAWKIARPGLYYEDFKNTVTNVKGDYTSQVTDNHLISAGAQGRFHKLDRVLRAAYIGGQFSTYKNYVEETWDVSPKELGFYVQDKIQYAGLILNLGLRLDGLDLAAGDYKNYFAPFEDVTDATGGPVRVPVRGDNIKMDWFLSPRIGVSHPISDNAAMYFSFSRVQQAQPFSRLYTNYNDFGNPSLPVVARTGQDPIRSTNYDLGVQWSFADGWAADINAYYKDIQNYGAIGFQITPAAPWRLYILNTNFGYADSRGLELTINKRLTKVTDFLSIGGRFSYAYSYIKASIFAGGNTTTFSTVSGDSATYGGQLPFDQINYYNTYERNVLGGNSTLTGGYDRPHRITYNVFLRFPNEITLSSIGTFSSGFYFTETLAPDSRARKLGEGPWNARVDLRIEKAFTISGLGRLAVYVDVLNAFNARNIVAYNTTIVGQQVWEKSVSNSGNLDENQRVIVPDPTGGPTISRAVTPDGSLVYDIPREVYFGVNITLP